MSHEPGPPTISNVRPPARAAVPPRARLIVVHPPELARAQAAVIGLGAERHVIGRRPPAGRDHTTILDHPTVSRAHLAVAFDPERGGHLAEDLGSHNGTHLDGARSHGPRVLDDGAVLRLGDVLLIYERDPAPPSEGSPVSAAALPGRAASLHALRAKLPEAARDRAPALLIGETGVGKERLAAELHRLSGRKGRFVAVNCAALAEPLAESQLFGHLRGAFTGATEAQPGLFRAAHEGTLFLDEIGDLPPPLQPKLLRVLQEGEVHPVGSARAVPVDVRVVAATHRDLGRAAAQGEFRADLYARLFRWELAVPPLRRRRADILDWIARLRGAGSPLLLDADAAEALLLHPWPLNLRAVDRLARELRGHDGPVTLPDLPAWLDLPGAGNSSPPETDAGPAAAPAPRRSPTREEFEAAFAAQRGSVHALARQFGRDRRQIYRWLDAWGLRDRRPK